MDDSEHEAWLRDQKERQARNIQFSKTTKPSADDAGDKRTDGENNEEEDDDDDDDVEEKTEEGADSE